MTRFVESTITFPYKRSLGPVLGPFMTALTERRILGTRNGDEVLVPPMEWDPRTGAELANDLIEVGPCGTVQSWTWVPSPSSQHPLQHAFAFAFITLDGATTPLLHAVDAVTPDAMHNGMRVAPRWRTERVGAITDIVCFVPGETSSTEGDTDSVADTDARDTGTGETGTGETQPVLTMAYNASITYRNPVPLASDRAIIASREQRLLGSRCPVCDRVYSGGKGFCPIDAVEFNETHDVDLPHSGTITNFAIVTPVQYPGQTETEPFARVFVLLDDTDVILSYQAVIEMPADEVCVGRRVSAVFASPAEDIDEGASMGGAYGALIGWMANGEPTIDDPELVNRIF